MKRGRVLKALWEAGRSFNRNKVDRLLTQALENETLIRVLNVEAKEKKQSKPICCAAESL